MDISKLEFKQLLNTTKITFENLQNIAQLIYETDPYIYPAMFDNIENAITIIPDLITKNDDMFQKHNFYVVFFQKKIIGLILWKKGKVKCDLNLYEQTFKQHDINLPENFYYTFNAYFKEYENQGEENISIINVCIDKQYRGHKIGNILFEYFIKNHKNDPIELFVLKDNIHAVNLYKKYRFKITEELKGFAITKEKPDCLKMVRSNKNV